MDELRAMRYFLAVAETTSFSKAAAKFRVPASSISRRIAELERQLGATLLKRSTRVVALTEIGERYREDIGDVVRQLDLSNESVRQHGSRPMGRLKISSTVGFGERILIPVLEEFQSRYPDVTLDLELNDAVSVLARDDVDLAIRGGYAPDERVIAVQLMDNRFLPAASPSYWRRNGMPSHPFELREHLGLYFRTPQGAAPWLSQIDGQWHDVSPRPVLVTNAGSWMMEKAVKGDGIVMMPHWVLSNYLQSGDLQMLQWQHSVSVSQNPNMGIFLLYQKQRYHLPKIKVAVDFIVARVRGGEAPAALL